MQPQYPGPQWGHPQNPYPQNPYPPPPPKKQPGVLAAIGAIIAMCVICVAVGKLSPPPSPAPATQPAPMGASPSPAAAPVTAAAVPSAAPSPAAAPAAAQADGRQFITSSCADAARLFGLGTRLSELQQNALWDSDYEGRWVRWPVRVTEIGSTFGQLQLHFKCPRSRAISSDGIAQFDDAQRGALMQIEMGSTVTLVARLTDHGPLLGLSLDDATLE